MTCRTRSLVPGPGWRRRAWGRGASAAALLLCLHPVVSLADPTMDVINEVKQQIVPLNDEVGLGNFVFTPGQVTLLSGSGATGARTGETAVAMAAAMALRPAPTLRSTRCRA